LIWVDNSHKKQTFIRCKGPFSQRCIETGREREREKNKNLQVEFGEWAGNDQVDKKVRIMNCHRVETNLSPSAYNLFRGRLHLWQSEFSARTIARYNCNCENLSADILMIVPSIRIDITLLYDLSQLLLILHFMSFAFVYKLYF
jgi:hypothetical protein